MLTTLRTLFIARSAVAEERLRDANAITLIEQKIRESETGLRAAKSTLASLIQRQRSEQRLADNLAARIDDLTDRARQALDDDRDDMAAEAAAAIATMENEQTGRRATLDALDAKVMRLRQTVEAAHRRIIDLKQGAITARAMRSEQRSQMHLSTTLAGQGSMEEADDLIKQVLGGDDPFEKSQILTEINSDLSHDTLTDRMADAGMGSATRSTANDVLKRLKSKS
ncbi:PspA/IM30 family protein [Actibacterium sp. 188UL27-1]|uniref:PspA/IM30 family protein n=1 Tax=Actibacterium sp. 188UL27-1 TaxID=2786961 RepID=UPI00195F1B85|nr:PspA/IM30 family protein [Actibacterium sp. 188UL27-1]MBM7068853.1 PspA/IM30 family protein [Actibacterium sp. 188UL27-1]